MRKMSPNNCKYENYYRQHCSKNNLNINNKFIDWINEIENLVMLNYEITLLDLPDENYMYHFENGLSINDMYNIIVSSNCDLLDYYL